MFSVTHAILGLRDGLVPKAQNKVVFPLPSFITWKWTLPIPCTGGDGAHSRLISLWKSFFSKSSLMSVWEGCWARANAGLGFFGTTSLTANIYQSRCTGWPWKVSPCRREWDSVGVKRGWLVRKLLQPAQTEKDQEQKRWVTPLREAKRTIFCSAVFNRVEGVLEGQTPRFWGLLLCLFAVPLGFLYYYYYYYYFLLPDTRASSWQPATELAWPLKWRVAGKTKAEMKSGWLCWHGVGNLERAQRSALQLCPCTCSAVLGKRARSGICCHGHPDWASRERGLQGTGNTHWRFFFSTTAALLLLNIDFYPQLCLIFSCLWCKAERTLTVSQLYVVKLWPCQLANCW